MFHGVGILRGPTIAGLSLHRQAGHSAASIHGLHHARQKTNHNHAAALGFLDSPWLLFMLYYQLLVKFIFTC
jgi:hypothetical protein